MKVTAATTEDMGWLIQRTGCALTPSARGIKAVDDTGRIHGMVAYDGWTPNAVSAHMATDHPAVWRTLLQPAFAYPFEQCDKRMLLVCVNSDNDRSVQLVRRFGFREIHRVQNGWSPSVDLLMFQMHREECRYLSRERKAA